MQKVKHVTGGAQYDNMAPAGHKYTQVTLWRV